MSNLVPLPEVLSEIAASGVGSKTVERMYDRVIGALGPELSILGEVPVEDIARAESSVLAEAITRLRAGKVIRDAGYDGEYGVIQLFEDGELKRARRDAVRGAGGEARLAEATGRHPGRGRGPRPRHPALDATASPGRRRPRPRVARTTSSVPASSRRSTPTSAARPRSSRARC